MTPRLWRSGLQPARIDLTSGTHAVPDVRRAAGARRTPRELAATAAAAVLGAAPHVLHHAGPLAGAALLGGAAGRAVFGALGLALMLPMLLRLRWRSGSWRRPAALAAAMAAAFALSSLLLAPALTDGERDGRAPAPAAAPGHDGARHDEHH